MGRSTACAKALETSKGSTGTDEQPAAIAPAVAEQPSPIRLPRYSPEEIAAMQEVAGASNHKPVFTPEEPKELFVYDPDRPLDSGSRYLIQRLQLTISRRWSQ
jgi:hypothetical protein